MIFTLQLLYYTEVVCSRSIVYELSMWLKRNILQCFTNNTNVCYCKNIDNYRTIEL